MGAPLTEAAIIRVQDMIASGRLAPGSRLPSEADLAIELGASRNTVREAVRALVTAKVLDVRRGDGTYVTSLRPELLLDGIGAAAELMQGVATSSSSCRSGGSWSPPRPRSRRSGSTGPALLELEVCLLRMTEASSQDELVQYDAEFHAQVANASGNETLASMLKGVSGRTVRTRAWRGIIEEGATERTVQQHADILRALRDGDPVLAHAAALVHVATTEDWVRRLLEDDHAVEDPTGPGRERTPAHEHAD